MFSKTKWLWLTLLTLGLAACGGDSNNYSNNNSSRDMAALKVVAASADAPSLRILTDNDPSDDSAAREFPAQPAYGQAVTVALTDSQRLTVEYILPEKATTSVKHQQALDPFDVELETDRRYEIYVMGSYPEGEYWLTDMSLNFPEAGEQARISLAHAAANMGALDFHLVESGAAVTTASMLARLEPRSADHSARVAPGDYQLKITTAGSLEVIYTSDELTFSAGSDITLAALENAWIKQGVTGKPPVVVSHSTNSESRLMFSADSGVDVRVMQASPDAGPLDVAVDDGFSPPLAEDLTLGALTPYHSLKPGIHNIKVTPADTATAKLDTDLNFFNAVAWTLYVYRPWDNLELMSVPENVRPIGAHARVRVVHVSEAQGAVNLYITNEGVDLSEEDAAGNLVYEPRVTNLRRRTASGYMPVAPGTYDLNLTEATSTTVVQGPITETFEAGEVYTLVVMDEADAATATHTWLRQ